MLYILLVSVTDYNALNQIYKLVDSFPVVENAQYLFAKIPDPLKGEARTFQKTVLYVISGNPK